MAEYNRNLWAPWRMKYLRSLSEQEGDGCFLCGYAEAPECEAAAIEALVEECDARRFAPRAASLDPELQERAETAAREFAERPR